MHIKQTQRTMNTPAIVTMIITGIALVAVAMMISMGIMDPIR